MAIFRLEDQAAASRVVCFSKGLRRPKGRSRRRAAFSHCDADQRERSRWQPDGGEVAEQRNCMRGAAAVATTARKDAARDHRSVGRSHQQAADRRGCSALKQFHGHVPVSLRIIQAGRWRVEGRLPQHLAILPSDECLQAIETLCGRSAIHLR